MAQPQLVRSDLHRTFETVSDRQANQTVSKRPLQRTNSWRSLYTDGSVVREHVHDNARSGGDQFQHVIGGFNQDGTRWGRNDPWNG